MIQKYNDLVVKYNKLVNVYKKQRETNLNLIKMLELSIQDPFSNFTFDRFKKCLKLEYTYDKMPTRPGIYAYHNTKDDLVYVGQSVNMQNRLKQHFKNGKIKISGHDCDFKNLDDWKFYVLEFTKKDKATLDLREAYWIVLAKVATANKKSISLDKALDLEQAIINNTSVKDIIISSTIVEKAKNINKTKGNNIR